MVVAVGGDGTVNEVLHGLMTLPTEARPALAVIPLGTANDFARGCGIPLDPSQALALCVAGDPVAADVGRANNRWFINAASIGFGAVVTATTPPELKRLLGGAAYTLMAAILATNFRPYEGRLLLPDQELTGPDVVAIVGNGRQTRALLDDGLLDLLVVREIPANKLLDAVRELQLSPLKANTFLTGRCPGRILMRCAPCRSISTANLPSSPRFARKRLRARSG